MATISKSGISPLQQIKAEHLTRIIDALSGETPNIDIIISGSVTASNFSGDGSGLYNLNLPTGSGLIDLENINSLKNFSGIGTVHVQGYYTPNDGGGGIFYWDNSSVETEDLGTIFESNLINFGRWKRYMDSREVNVKWFGAVGSNDDTIGFINAISSSFDIFIPGGEYIFTRASAPTSLLDNFVGIRVPSNIKIRGENKNNTFIYMDGITNGDTGSYYNAFNIINESNITIENITIQDYNNNFYTPLLTFSEASVGIHIFGTNSKNITTKNVQFKNILGHGYQDNSDESYNNVVDNIAINCSQNGLNINTKYAVIRNNKGYGNGFGLIEAACGNSIIDGNIASDNHLSGIGIGGFVGENTLGYGDNNIITNNISYGNAVDGMRITNGIRNSIISNNIIYDNGQIGIVCTEPLNKITNNIYNSNTIYNNGISGSLSSSLGIYVNSKGNIFTNNNLYYTGSNTNWQKFGFSVERDNNTFINNFVSGNNNFDYEFLNCLNIDYTPSNYDRYNIVGTVNFKRKSNKSTISYNGYPITQLETYLDADNVVISQSAILPKADTYPIGQELFIYDGKGNASTNIIKISPFSGDNITGSVSDYIISSSYGSVTLLTNGINSWIIK